jgi:hypothetical protein
MKEGAYGTIVVNLYAVLIVGETMYGILYIFPYLDRGNRYLSKCHLCDTFAFLIINI